MKVISSENRAAILPLKYALNEPHPGRKVPQSFQARETKKGAIHHPEYAANENQSRQSTWGKSQPITCMKGA